MKPLVKQFCLITVFFLMLTTITSAADTYWLGTTGNWSVSSNWDNGEPGQWGVAKINNGGTAQIASGYEECHSLYIGYNSGDIGTVDMTGGSLSVSYYLNVGKNGNGILNIANGSVVDVGNETWVARGSSASGEINFDNGTLTTDSLLCSVDDLKGTGTINVSGLVSDLDLVFDATHGLDQTFTIDGNIGQNITVNLNIDGTIIMAGAGYGGSGTMSISDGVTIESNYGYIGYKTGSEGAVTVENTDSKWTNYKNLHIGNEGKGLLNITNAGTVVNLNGYIRGLASEVIVNGTSSTWKNSHSLHVINGSLNVLNGGNVYSGGYEGGYHFVYYHGYISGGQVVVSGQNSMWMNDYDLNINGSLNIFDSGTVISAGGYTPESYKYFQTYIGSSVGSSGEATVAGVDSNWINYGNLTIGDYGNGNLTISSAGIVSNYSGSIGDQSGSNGTVTVDGAGSIWENSSSLTVGHLGEGALSITRGGAVNNTDGRIGNRFDSIGKVTVDGTGSTWANRDLYTGNNGSGTLTITAGGLVKVARTLTIDGNGGDDGYINMATNGMLALYDSGWISGDDLNDFLDLIEGTDAINYWNGSTWANITNAIIGVDYTLEHISDGRDLDGYTILTVNTPDQPDPDINNDGDVGLHDFTKLASKWLDINCVDPDWCNRADIDNSGDVGMSDMQILGGHWLEKTD